MSAYSSKTPSRLMMFFNSLHLLLYSMGIYKVLLQDNMYYNKIMYVPSEVIIII